MDPRCQEATAGFSLKGVVPAMTSVLKNQRLPVVRDEKEHRLILQVYRKEMKELKVSFQQ